ncbi:TonB-dependent receptor plug domain-containing protein [Bacteroidota bacterium]
MRKYLIFLAFCLITTINCNPQSLNNYRILEVDSLDLKAETSTIIQKFSTIFNSNFINKLPFRGMKNILSLSPGVVLHNDKLYARGSRDDEIQYLIDGVPITDVMDGGILIELPQEAFESIEIQTDGVSTRYGNANSGYVFHELKRGTNEFKANFKYLSDNITFKNSKNSFNGDKRLGTYWFGHNEILCEVSGPIIKDKLTFYALGHHKYERDQNPQPFPGADLGRIYNIYDPDSINLILSAGAQPANQLENYSTIGKLDYLSDNLIFSFSGIYSVKESSLPEGNNILNFLNYFRTPQSYFEYYMVNLNVQYKISNNTEYFLTLGFSKYIDKKYDPLLKENFLNYYDRESNEDVGVFNFRNNYSDPGQHYIKGFSFNRSGRIISDYSLHNQSQLIINFSLNTMLSNHNQISFGGTFKQYFIKHYEISKYLLSDYRSYLEYYGSQIPEYHLQYNFDSPNNYGYNVFGEEINSDDIYGSRNPFNANIFFEHTYTIEDLLISSGMRFDYFYSDNYKFNFSHDYYTVYRDRTKIDTLFSKVKGQLFLSPRISLSYRINEQLLFYTTFGKYVQQNKFSNIYQGMYNFLSSIQSDFFSTNGIGFDLTPISTYITEIGFKYCDNNFFSFSINGFYKKTTNLPILYNYWYNIAILSYLENKGETISKGLEISAGYQNGNGINAQCNIGLQDAKGPSIYYNSWMGLQYDELEHSSDPVTMAPLENSYALRGNIFLNYDFKNRLNNSLLKNLSLSAFINFNTGHPYNRITLSYYHGRLNDIRGHHQVGDFNSFTTHTFFQFDFRISKSIEIFNDVNMTFDLMLVNIFDTRNEINVFPTSGQTKNDNILNSGYFDPYVEVYGEDVLLMHKVIDIDYYNEYKRATGFNLFGPPRQIFFGVTLEY